MKKKQPLIVFVFLLISSMTLMSSCSTDDDNTPPEVKVVNFPDAMLKTVIKKVLGLAASEDITEENILELTELDVTGAEVEGYEEITVLTGLEKAVNLTLLNLGDTKVTDINPIKDLKKIEYLRFNDTPLEDLSPISNYTSLTYFNANTATNITDISPLVKNTGLQELILREVPMGNEGLEDVISHFTKLYRLNIRETGVTDITVLGELMAAGALLKTTPGAAEAGGNAELDLTDNEIESYDPIREYVNNNTAISKISPNPLPEN